MATTVLQDLNDSHVLQDKPLRVLGLFSKRQPTALTLNFSLYEELLKAFSCTICMDVFINPVFLRCSHRFCKECFEKHCRINNSVKEKACPNCRQGYTTKRDSKIDSQISSLVTSLFGSDIPKLRSDIAAAEATMRRTSRSYHDQLRKRVKINLDDDSLQANHDGHSRQTTFLRSRRRRAGIIDDSSDQQSVSLYRSGPSAARNNSLLQSNSKESIFKEQSAKEPTAKEWSLRGRKVVSEQHQSKQSISSTQPTSQQPVHVIEARRLLQVEFGQDYLYELLRYTSLICTMPVVLMRHPDSEFNTPQLRRGNLRVPVKIYAQALYELIADQLLIDSRELELLVKESAVNTMVVIEPSMSLVAVSIQYWRSLDNVRLTTLSETVNDIKNHSKSTVAAEAANRIIYYRLKE